MRIKRTVCDICGADITERPNKMAYVLRRKTFAPQYPDESDWLHKLDICEPCMTAITAALIKAKADERKKNADTGEGHRSVS